MDLILTWLCVFLCFHFLTLPVFQGTLQNVHAKNKTVVIISICIDISMCHASLQQWVIEMQKYTFLLFVFWEYMFMNCVLNEWNYYWLIRSCILFSKSRACLQKYLFSSSFFSLFITQRKSRERERQRQRERQRERERETVIERKFHTCEKTSHLTFF